MRPKPESFPDLTVPVRRRRTPVAHVSALGFDGSPRSGSASALVPPSIDEHGDSLVVAEALVQLLAELGASAADHDEPPTQPPPFGPGALMAAIRAGGRPGDGADVGVVDPVSIAFLAIVRVVPYGRGLGSQCGQVVHQLVPAKLRTLPKKLRGLQTAGQLQTLKIPRPTVPERIVHRIHLGRASCREPGRPYQLP
jgi:hypothetical protein